MDIEEIRMVAYIEREMDAGRQPFVVFGGERFPVPSEVMTYLGLESGQTVGQELLDHIFLHSAAHINELTAGAITTALLKKLTDSGKDCKTS